MLSFVIVTFISRTLVALVCPEGFILEVKLIFLKSIIISHQTVDYRMSSKEIIYEGLTKEMLTNTVQSQGF